MSTRTATNDRLPIPNTPPDGWEFETPRYRLSRDIQPPPKSRFRFERPFSQMFDSDEWQYGESERPLKGGEIIETRHWPHPSFRPLNYGAAKVLDFFNSRIKSRLPLSPWQGDRIRLDDGLTGTIVVSLVPPQLQPVDLRPAS